MKCSLSLTAICGQVNGDKKLWNEIGYLISINDDEKFYILVM